VKNNLNNKTTLRYECILGAERGYFFTVSSVYLGAGAYPGGAGQQGGGGPLPPAQ